MRFHGSAESDDGGVEQSQQLNTWYASLWSDGDARSSDIADAKEAYAFAAELLRRHEHQLVIAAHSSSTSRVGWFRGASLASILGMTIFVAAFIIFRSLARRLVGGTDALAESGELTDSSALRAVQTRVAAEYMLSYNKGRQSLCQKPQLKRNRDGGVDYYRILEDDDEEVDRDGFRVAFVACPTKLYENPMLMSKSSTASTLLQLEQCGGTSMTMMDTVVEVPPTRALSGRLGGLPSLLGALIYGGGCGTDDDEEEEEPRGRDDDSGVERLL